MVTKMISDKEKNFGESDKDRSENFKERLWFIKYWVEFMKKNSDEVWSKGQKELIDSQFMNVKKK